MTSTLTSHSTAEHDPADTTTTILEFVGARFPNGELGARDDIFAQGYVNSLFAMELVMFLEKTFAVTIPNDALRIDSFRTAESMSALVTRLAAP